MQRLCTVRPLLAAGPCRRAQPPWPSSLALVIRGQGRRLASSYGARAGSAGPPPPSRGQGFCLAIAAAGVASGLALHWLAPGHRLTAAPPAQLQPETGQEIVNWSGTHVARPRRLYEPRSVAELEQVVAEAHRRGQPLRPVGAATSPNGIGFSDEGMVSVAQLDRVLWIEPDKRLIRVEAGIRVDQVVEALRPHGLTLENYASIKEQQIAGYTQTSAHGTGAQLPPVDGQVVAMKLVTPARGTLELRADGPAEEAELFRLARVGLGALGVVAEVTLRCVPAHRLVETTTVMRRSEVRRGHAERLQRHQHVRYMWIPYEDAVVVVTGDPLKDGQAPPPVTAVDQQRALQPFVQILREQVPKQQTDVSDKKQAAASEQQQVEQQQQEQKQEQQQPLNFADLRDRVLALGPLRLDIVRRCNRAEAAYWRGVQGVSKVDWSDKVLAFECGGQQWVFEMALPAGRRSQPSLADLDYMEALLREVEARQVCAPAPIEQRWSAASQSPMSPAYSTDADALFSWVGIIMYLPTVDAAERAAIGQQFAAYRQLIHSQLQQRFQAHPHWAKTELPTDSQQRAALRQWLRQHYPVAAFNHWRHQLDPNGILSNAFICEIFDGPDAQ